MALSDRTRAVLRGTVENYPEAPEAPYYRWCLDNERDPNEQMSWPDYMTSLALDNGSVSE